MMRSRRSGDFGDCEDEEYVSDSSNDMDKPVVVAAGLAV